jgi:hypothetical protein
MAIAVVTTSYWYPVSAVIFFKRAVYEQALKELEPALHGAPDPGSGQQ